MFSTCVVKLCHELPFDFIQEWDMLGLQQLTKILDGLNIGPLVNQHRQQWKGFILLNAQRYLYKL